ncbi:MAG: ribosomal protein S18-alanine N-acetyltransferase [Rhodospirillaceae bacterium]
MTPHFISIDYNHVEVLAALHHNAFDMSWRKDSFADLLSHPGTYGWIACDKNPLGFILCRSVADESEILTLAVAKTNRRLGLGTCLLAATIDREQAQGSEGMHLEVAADNTAARALYEKAGFHISGKRKGYYARNGDAVDAILMYKSFNRA